ncbi:hypothetical protein ACOSQ3_007673 [Xanthoceras sorbifolium]
MMMKLHLASKKLMKLWLVMAVLIFLLSLVDARGGAGGGHGGHRGRGSTWGTGVLMAGGSHRGGGGAHRRNAATPSAANAWLSWSLGFFVYVALILLAEIAA